MVTFPGAGAGGNFLERMLEDLIRMMGQGSASGGARVELARTMAQNIASGGEAEGNVDPVERIELEELVRLAERHVLELTGLDPVPAGSSLTVTAVRPGAWAWETVEDWQFLLEAMGQGGQGPAGDPGTTLPVDPGLGLLGFGGDPGEGGSGGAGELLARYMATIGPMLAALQLGFAIGHLARSTLGQFELPIPRPAGSRLLVVPGNITAFAESWSLPPDQVRLWVCLREVTTQAVLSRPHVADRLRGLLGEVVQGMAEDTAGMVERLDTLDPNDPEALQRLMGAPESLLESAPSPERERAAQQLTAVTAALLGYVEHILDQASTRLLGGRTALTEAWRRRQVDRESGDRAAELLVGMDLGPGQVARGVAFVEGIVERAGEEGLARLWENDANLPTPAEIEAPGLWLERISLEDAAG